MVVCLYFDITDPSNNKMKLYIKFKVPQLKFCVLTMAIVRKSGCLVCVRWRKSFSSYLAKHCAVRYLVCVPLILHSKNQVHVLIKFITHVHVSCCVVDVLGLVHTGDITISSQTTQKGRYLHVKRTLCP